MTHQLAGIWVQRFVPFFVLLLVGLALDVTSAFAQTRPAPQATQHALDELANCHAQRRPECPTSTATATMPPRAAPTVMPTLTPTELPTASAEPTVTPLPVLPAPPPGDDPAPGYTRPGGSGWLELALPQGRWAIYQADDCVPQVEAWRQAWLTTADDGEVDINAQGFACGLVAAVWQSDAPCGPPAPSVDAGSCGGASRVLLPRWP